MPYFIIDARDKKVIKTWDGASEYDAESTGGNDKVGHHHWDFDLYPDYDSEVCECFVDYPPLELSRYLYSAWPPWTFYCKMENDVAQVLSCDPWETITIHNCEQSFDLQDGANGGYSPAVDVLGFASAVHDMYSDWYGISDPINMSGITSPLRYVVYCNTQTAQWCDNKIIFGNGNDNYHPFTSLNVVSHEMYHGRSKTHGGIGSIKGTTLALHGIEEAFCDLAGQAAEAYFYGTGNIDWLTGSRIRHTEPGYRRNMKEPREDCPSHHGCTVADGDPLAIAEDGETYPQNEEYDYAEYYSLHNCYCWEHGCTHSECDYHDVAGIFNKALYTLAQSYGIKETFRCVLYADAVWGSTLSGLTGQNAFNEAASIIVLAADNYGFSWQAVVNAFATVGVTASPPPQPPACTPSSYDYPCCLYEWESYEWWQNNCFWYYY